MPVAAAPAVNDVIARVETNPLDPESWQPLSECFQLAGEALHVQCVEIVIAGLRGLEQSAEEARAENRSVLTQTPLAAPLFARLAKSCDDPRLLKEAGMLYLSVWRMPEIARQHFELCRQLGEPEKYIRPLIEAASLATHRVAAAAKGQKAVSPGPKGTSHPGVADLMRQTGLSLPSRPPAVPALKKEEKNETSPSLPKSGIECLREVPSAIAQGNLARAQALLLRAGENPRNGREIGQAWADLGQAHYDAESYPEMEIAYQEASKFEPETMACHFNLALAKHLNQKFDQAEALYLTADRLRPNHPKTWCNLGSLYFQTGRYALAEEALRRCLRADGDYARAWDNLASALGAQNKLDEALEAGRHAVELRPDYAEAHYKMGLIYFGKNRAAEAAEAFRHACALPHLAPSAYALLGTIHARLAQTDAATEAIRQAAQLNPKGELLWTAWNELGKAHYARGAYEPAAAAFREATALEPETAEGWFNLALSHHLKGDREQAREFYRRAVHLNEKSLLGWHNLGTVCGELNLFPEASDAFQHELEIRPDNSRTWYDLGVSLEGEGRHDEAQAAFRMAEDLDQPLPSAAGAA